MAMVINHNLPSLNAYRNLSINSANTSSSLEKLSSGLRINKAGDDAAGLSISEKMRSQIRGLDQASRNAQDGISLIQTAEGALNETHSMLQRMRELTVQANNGTNTTDDLDAIQQELDQLSQEITATAQKTQFNGQNLLTGTFGTKVDMSTANTTVLTVASVDTISYNGGLTSGAAGAAKAWTLTGLGDGSYTISDGTDTYTSNIVAAGTAGVLNFEGKISISVNDAIADDDLDGMAVSVSGNSSLLQIGANANQQLDLSFNDMQANALGTTPNVAGGRISDVNVKDATQTFATRLDIIDAAIKQVSTERAKMGAMQNRLEHTIANLGTSSENLTAAESRIRDVDMAKEMTEFTKNNIKDQAATAMLAQANQQPQAVLQLLK